MEIRQHTEDVLGLSVAGYLDFLEQWLGFFINIEGVAIALPKVLILSPSNDGKEFIRSPAIGIEV